MYFNSCKLVLQMQVPLYMTLGLAVAFALTFSIVDAGALKTQ